MRAGDFYSINKWVCVALENDTGITVLSWIKNMDSHTVIENNITFIDRALALVIDRPSA